MATAPSQSVPQTPFTLRERVWKIIGLVFSNIFGSDATVATTAVYTWLANQMSHTTMGFFVGVVWIAAAERYFPQPGWLVWLVLVFPVAKDAIDYGMDAFYRADPFVINHMELLLDWLTDDFFWWFGMMMAFALVSEERILWGLLAATLAVGILGSYLLGARCWLVQKQMYDVSRMPINFTRLIKYPKAERDSRFTAAAIRKLAEFQQHAAAHRTGDSLGRHYVLTGGRAVHRSELAVSMGCEYISHWKGTYMISAVKLLEDPTRLTTACKMAAALKRQVHCFIIDDLNVSLPIPEMPPPGGDNSESFRNQVLKVKESVSGKPLESLPSATLKMFEFATVFSELRKAFPYVSTIWALSAGKLDVQRVAAWQAFIPGLVSAAGQTAQELITIELHST